MSRPTTTESVRSRDSGITSRPSTSGSAHSRDSTFTTRSRPSTAGSLQPRVSDNGTRPRPPTRGRVQYRAADIFLIPLTKKVLEPPDKSFFVASKEVLERLENREIKGDTIFVYYNMDGTRKSTLDRNLVDAAYSVICSRKPLVKMYQVISFDTVLKRFNERQEKVQLEKLLKEVQSGTLAETHFEGLVSQFAHGIKEKLRERPGNRSRIKTRGSIKMLKEAKVSAILGYDIHGENQNANPGSRAEVKQIKPEKDSVLEAVIFRTNRFLSLLAPLTITIMYRHEDFFKQLISSFSTEKLESLYDMDIVSESMKKPFIETVLTRARQHYRTDTIRRTSKDDATNEVVLFGFYDDKKYTHSGIIRETFCGIQVEIRPQNVMFDEDCKEEIESNYHIKSVEQQLLDNINACIQEHSNTLWDSHSNLNVISADIFGNGSYDFFIILVCSGRGFIPYKEKNFPKSLTFKNEEISIRVYEGYFSFGPSFANAQLYNDPLSIGCTIGAENRDVAGSLGLFIETGDLNGFLTCTHVLYDCLSSGEWTYDPVRVLQPGPQDLYCQLSNDERYIGMVMKDKAIFTPSFPTDDISVDATLVVLEKRIPNNEVFVVRDKQQLQKAGYSTENPPELSVRHHGEEITSREHGKQVLKFGASSGLTRGYINIGNVEVRTGDPCVKFLGNCSSPTKIMKGQLEVKDYEDVFFVSGDSGSAVFCKEENGKLYCIGIAIGYVEMARKLKSTIVTPINAILKAMDLSWNDVKTFH